MKYSEADQDNRRIVAVDPGLLTPEELLARNKDRKTLRELVRQQSKAPNKRLNLSSILVTLEEHVRKFLDTAQIRISYNDFMTFITIYVLFGNDLRILYFPPSSDQFFYFMNNLSFFLFLIEITLTSWVKTDFSKGFFKCKGYMFSFFFWLDFLAILSMIPDLTLTKINSLSFLSRAGRASEIGAKTGRVLRMARMLRLVKLYKVTKHRYKEKAMLLELKEMHQKGQLDEKTIEQYFDKVNNKKQSKVGAELSDIITRRVIVAVLLMLLVVPLLTYSSSIDNEKEATIFLQQVNIEAGFNETNCDYLLGSAEQYKEFMNGFTRNGIENDEYLIGLQIEPSRCDSELLIDFLLQDTIDKLRTESFSIIEPESQIIDGHTFFVIATFNRNFYQREWSRYGIYMTLFVIFMLAFMSSQFKADARRLVLAPIENMMEMVNMVANDPLQDYDFTELSRKNQYETRVVQIAIQKISSLLRVGFGVAGAEIISKNMSVEEGASVLQPMIPGKRIYAIFGFCDIHSFDYCTEMIQDEIMTFVNNVARIVHLEVTRWGGLCNKNLGNAFLMVWRVGDDKTLQKSQGLQLNKLKVDRPGTSPGLKNRHSITVDLRRVPGLDVMADKALIGFLKVIVEINRDPQVLAYRDDGRLAQDGVDFKLRMGFGLHSGWAIEGAVGSLKKVDATYLSPHVNMSARMMAATRQFGVSILMTERFHEVMTDEAKFQCRKIDVVTVKGSAVPMPIYTYDTLQDQVFPTLTTPKFSNLDLDEVLTKKAEEYEPKQWEQDDDLKQLQRLSTPEFRETFRRGIEQYLNGDWIKARDYLEKADEMMEEIVGDGPSKTILQYMSNREWLCPEDWKGYRPLTSK